MFSLLGPRNRYCDGLNRRSFLQVGSLALGGLTLPKLFQAEAQAGVQRSHKSVIMVYLSGGLAHQDTFDLKPNAPAEIKGEFKPIDTNVPGIQIGEHLPRLAANMDKMVLVRSIVGLRDEHSSFHTMTGYGMSETQRTNKPHVGAVIAKALGQVDPVVPAFVDLFPVMQHKPYNSPAAGPLGRMSNPVKLDGNDLDVMKPQGLSLQHLDERRQLLEKLDGLRRDSMDIYYQRAFDVLSSNKLVEALDVEKEPVKVRDRYGRGSPKHQGDGAPQWNDQLLVARRLVEAGARCVTVAYGFWDTHGQNFRSLKSRLPLFDQGISALIEDIYQRGLDKDVTVLVWGEFGRTPKINKDAGRDHWAPVNGALFAGGGMKTGQVIGSTDKDAAYAKDNPIHYHDVLASVYHNLGIDPHAMVTDVSGRPMPILPSTVQPITKAHG
ncbi:MAG: DUF1501 domain-containing protein, partial [Planctomycetia bacterium]|nr:DUF1501 domain-containing protein [Planctomycetia bacterium]